jgi:hypothetical protein
MDSSGNETAGPSDVSRLEYQCGSLRRWLNLILALVIAMQVLTVIASGTLAVYLFWLSKTTKKDLAGFRPQATQAIAEYEKVNAPVMSDFLKRATEYGKTHPDFMPILAKYGIRPGGPTGAVPTTAISPRSVPSKK